MAWAERPEGQEQGGYKMDAHKPRMDLLPPGPLTNAAEVFTYGANKYAEIPDAYGNNWLQGMRFGSMYAALQRHLTAFWGGEDIDAESGLPHMSLALACAMMLNEYATNPAYAALDDRPTRERIERQGQHLYAQRQERLAQKEASCTTPTPATPNSKALPSPTS